MQTQTVTPKRQKKYVCSRPRLAEYLVDQGFTCTVKDNMFTPGLKAWEFDLSTDLAWLVDDYYKSEVGKLPPKLIQDTLKKEQTING